MEMTGGQALAQSLKVEGVETIFALPGIQLDYLFDAIWEERDHFKVLHTRHEQATAYMADGFARSTGKVGTFVVVPGPGVLNATAALSTAYACSSPVLCVTGQIESALIGKGRGALHEINDQPGLLRHLTKSSEGAMRPEEIPSMVRRAMRGLKTGRPRPVSIEVPPDILGTVADVTLLEPEAFDRPRLHQADPDLLERAAEVLGKAERPAICAGGGVLSAEAWEEVRELARILEAPVIMTANGRGVVSDHDYRAQAGRVAQAQLLAKADAVLAIGTRFLAGIPGPQGVEVTGTLIQADIDPEEIGRNRPVDLALLGDAKHTAGELVRRVPKHNRTRPSREAELRAVKGAQAKAFDATPWQRDMVRVLREVMPEDGILVSESTQVGYVAQAGAFPVYQPRGMFTSGYQGTLGYGYATALGVQVGNPDRKVVSISGDGGFMYNVQELATHAQQGIPLVAVVFNDNLYGNVRRIQEQRYNGHGMGTELNNPDFQQVAELFGVAGYRAKDAGEFRSALDRALASNKPALIEVAQPRTPDLPAAVPMQQLPPRPVLSL
ncbi:MAG: thiamine pyrophosphate-binding protein [Dehalococcoidia bacterium]|nr:MAG: thiamine pyrophosphate-binding protein [Dehalococcoidia bacterium]